LRPVGDSNEVMIDFEFDTLGQAQAMLAALRVWWGRVEGTVLANPQSGCAADAARAVVRTPGRPCRRHTRPRSRTG
jgi:hypothetical protein